MEEEFEEGPQPAFRDRHLQELYMISLHAKMRSREIKQWQQKAARLLGKIRRKIASIQAAEGLAPHPIQ